MTSFESKLTKRIKRLEDKVEPILQNIPLLMTLFDEPMLVDYALLKMAGKDVRVQLVEGDGTIITNTSTETANALCADAKVKIGDGD